MKASIIIIISLFIISCNKVSLDDFDSNEIAVRYGDMSMGHWTNGHDQEDRIYFSVASEVSKEDGYYLLKFDSHPVIHLPELKLEVYKIESVEHSGSSSRYYFFNLKENPYFKCEDRSPYSENIFHVRPTPLRRPSIDFYLRIRSKDPDSLYFIRY